MKRNLLCSALLLGSVMSVTAHLSFAQSMTQVKIVASGIDDAEENITGSAIGEIDLTSSDLELSTDGSDEQVIGLRFTNINIPAGATIERAFIQFTSKNDKDPVLGDIEITAEYTGNATSFLATAFDITSRTTVSATPVVWPGSDAGSWANGQPNVAGEDQRTPDIKSVLQPVFEHESWSLGNSVVVLLSGSGVRNAFSYNGSAEHAPKLIIEFSGAAILPLEATLLPIEKNSNWKYNDQGDDLGTTWFGSSYDDSDWSYGPGKLGYSDNPTTTLSYGPSSSSKYPTYYFRKHIGITDLSGLNDSLDISLLYDDGAVVYINGNEIFRTNMPEGEITYSTFASAEIDGSAESSYEIFRISKEHFVEGENVIAVEIHQSSATGPDLGFDLSMEEVPEMELISFPIPKLSQWKYLDDGSDQGTDYTALTYDDASWAYGNGILGYGDPSDQATTLSYGPSSSEKYPTAYFRKKILIEDLTALTENVKVELLRDDGAIVFINGNEVIRSNMPEISDYLTYSSETIDGSAEDAYNVYYLPKTAFTEGENVIAVEIHQRSAGSSDISFDMSIINYTAPEMPEPCDPLASDHISNFVSVFPSAQPDSLRIPATHTFQMLIQSGVPYTDIADGNTKGTFDFTGYIPIDGSSTNGYLSLNHEGSLWPSAGVSMMDIQYDGTTQLWEITNNEPIDFSVVEGTGRNCSGGITPWGTIITCEETLPSADANADGYYDVGWAVEIDPVTKTIVDHDGDGEPDKLWQVGRMSHENVVVAEDGITLYEGNDENPGFIFKFVADEVGELGTGTLYTLKLDGELGTSTTGEWIEIPTSTPTQCNEVRTYANITAGATNFNQIEDVEISPFDGKIYFTSKSSGRVYRFQDDGMTISEMEIFVGEESSIYDIDYGDDIAGEQWRGGNDNLTFDDAGNLYVLQDGDRNHIWMVKPCHSQDYPQVELFAVTPAGCEPTGMTFSPDYKFMFVSMQHPSGTNTTEMIDATGNPVIFNKESAIVIARKEFLGTEDPLAVSFISFNAELQENNTVSLAWRFNNSSDDPVMFEVQRMVPGSEFRTLTTVSSTTGMENGSLMTSVDEQPYAGRNLYRIKAVEIDGNEVFSTIQNVNVKPSSAFSIAGLYPNPTEDKINIILIGAEDKPVEVTLYNAIGTQVMNQKFDLKYGNNKLELDMSSLSDGVYHMLITDGSLIINEKVIKK
ncbi:MAG: DUF839 domain-containing protein [Taibaiella sp.]|nr:DUF839 domain-containing protein [Taibaiella sp.]